MKNIFMSIFLLTFVFSCSVGADLKNTEIEPFNLGCKEAIEKLRELAKGADKSCEKDSDCVSLGAIGGCDCYQGVAPGTYKKPASLLLKFHERIFLSDIKCIFDKELLPCLSDGTRGLEYYTPYCNQGACSSKSQGKDLCGPGSGRVENNMP